MANNEEIEHKANLIIDHLLNKFDDLQMIYSYDSHYNLHVIYHDNPEIEFNDDFIDKSIELIDRYFQDEDSNNIVIGYNERVHDLLFQEKMRTANQLTGNYTFNNDNEKIITEDDDSYPYESQVSVDNFAYAA